MDNLRNFLFDDPLIFVGLTGIIAAVFVFVTIVIMRNSTPRKKGGFVVLDHLDEYTGDEYEIEMDKLAKISSYSDEELEAEDVLFEAAYVPDADGNVDKEIEEGDKTRWWSRKKAKEPKFDIDDILKIGATETVEEFVGPQGGVQPWVVINHKDIAEGISASSLEWVEGELERLLKQVSSMLRKVRERDGRLESGQSNFAAAVNRLGYVVDMLSVNEDLLSDESQRDSLKQVENGMEQLFHDMADLLSEAPGDVTVALPYGWPVSFASHVPSSGVVHVDASHDETFPLLGLPVPSSVELSRRSFVD